MMEYLWYTIAAMMAGIGTGLIGLSAATPMVPILITLCPSFSGETGAYQATAIALASDILASAATTATYIKHKNIDLKRGWIMLASILGMCTLGSFIAWLSGNIVLGSFTLFLTFCIGLRFLIKPESKRKNIAAKGQKMDWKGIAVSLFFGLTIGFGTGYVGSGGGMMMLVVFTAFLGMELKTAVGTSTFIMTFTALIASISHILIHPTILLERWPVLLFCIAVTTVSSLISARFANKVKNRTVGLVTGVVLTILGAVLILLRYWEYIVKVPFVVEILRCFGEYLLFIVPVALLLLVLNFTLKIPRFIFRKLLHIPAFASAAIVVWRADSWQVASLTLVLFAAIIYPFLHLSQRWKNFDNLFVQKKPGEIKTSLLLLFLTDAALVAICWGFFDAPYLAVTGILMWGCGDGAAALIGNKLGKHHVKLKFADSKKTWEGSCGMMIVSTVTGIVSLLIMTSVPWYGCLLIAAVTSLFGTYMELITHYGYDTVTVPVINIALLIAFHFIPF